MVLGTFADREGRRVAAATVRAQRCAGRPRRAGDRDLEQIRHPKAWRAQVPETATNWPKPGAAGSRALPIDGSLTTRAPSSRMWQARYSRGSNTWRELVGRGQRNSL